MQEIWKPIVDEIDFSEAYEVSSIGRVRSKQRARQFGNRVFIVPEKLLKEIITEKGYINVRLSLKSKGYLKRVSRLVATAFIPNPESKKEVNHIDGNKENNKASNLEWTTHSENIRHAFDTGLIKKRSGEKNPASKLTKLEVDNIIEMKGKRSVSDIASVYNVSKNSIYNIYKGNSWAV